MSSAGSSKLDSFLHRYGFETKMVFGGGVIRLISPKCGIDFDIDPQDNLHFVGIFNPHEGTDDRVNYVVKRMDDEHRVKSIGNFLQQWETYVDILEAKFQHLLNGNFEPRLPDDFT